VLLDCLDESNEKIRGLIVKALSERDELDLERVYHKLTALHWYVKSGSLRILGFRRDPLSVKKIEAVLDDPNTDVRMQAAWALGEIGGEQSLALLARLAQDSNNFVRASAEKALQRASDLKFT
jgi:HEAT repeat protein